MLPAEDWNRHNRELISQPTPGAPADCNQLREDILSGLEKFRRSSIEPSPLWTDVPFTEELFADLDEDDVDLYQRCLCPEFLRVNVYFTLRTLVLFVSEQAIAYGSPQQVSEIVETLTRLSKKHSGVGQVPVAGIFFLCSNAWTAYVGRESMQAMREAEEAGLAVAIERATELTAAIHRIIRFVSPGHVLNDFLGAIDAGDESLRLWNVVGEKIQELGLRRPLQELEDSIELELGRLRAEHKEWAERVFGDRPRQISYLPQDVYRACQGIADAFELGRGSYYGTRKDACELLTLCGIGIDVDTLRKWRSRNP